MLSVHLLFTHPFLLSPSSSRFSPTGHPQNKRKTSWKENKRSQPPPMWGFLYLFFFRFGEKWHWAVGRGFSLLSIKAELTNYRIFPERLSLRDSIVEFKQNYVEGYNDLRHWRWMPSSHRIVKHSTKFNIYPYFNTNLNNSTQSVLLCKRSNERQLHSGYYEVHREKMLSKFLAALSLIHDIFPRIFRDCGNKTTWYVTNLSRSPFRELIPALKISV